MKKTVSAMLAAALLAVSLMSCGEQVSSSGNITDKNDDNEPVTILVSTGSATAKMVEEMAKGYKKAGGEQIKIEKVGAKEFDQALMTKTMGGEGPDIIFFESNLFDTRTSENTTDHGVYWYIANNYLEDLTPYLEGDESYNPDNFVKIAVEGGRVGQYQMVFPTGYTTALFTVIPENMDKIGAPNGTETSAEEFFGKITNITTGIPDNGIKTPFASNPAIGVPYIVGNGFVDLAEKRVVFSDSARNMLKETYDNFMSDAERVAFWAKSDFDNEYEYLVTGEAAMSCWNSGMLGSTIDDIYIMSEYPGREKCLTSVPVPNEDDPTKHAASVVSSIGMNAASGHKMRAYKFLSYCINNDNFYSEINWSSMPTKISVCERMNAFGDQNNGLYEDMVSYYGEEAVKLACSSDMQEKRKKFYVDDIGSASLVDTHVFDILYKAIRNKSLSEVSIDALINQMELEIKQYLDY